MKKIILLTLVLGLLGCSASRKVSSSIKTEITDKTEANVTQKRNKDFSGRTESRVTEVLQSLHSQHQRHLLQALLQIYSK